jgi:orotate phosphoribosyltransferase
VNKKERLLELIKQEALSIKPIILSSGKKSDYYIDCRLITMHPEGAALIADIFFDMLKDKKIDALGGLTMGADPIAGAFAAVSFQRGRPIPTFIVRKEQKKHGTQKLVEGPLKTGMKVAIVDDVATSGGSLLAAIKGVEESGCSVAAVMVVVDRMEGGAEALAEKGHVLESIFTRDDLLRK